MVVQQGIANDLTGEELLCVLHDGLMKYTNCERGMGNQKNSKFLQHKAGMFHHHRLSAHSSIWNINQPSITCIIYPNLLLLILGDSKKSGLGENSDMDLDRSSDLRRIDASLTRMLALTLILRWMSTAPTHGYLT